MKHIRQRRQQKSTKPARTAVVQIEKPIYGGAFLGRIEGKATFVPLTLPGEQARVRMVDEKRSYISAEPEEIIASSPNRVVPGCPHFGACGGCNYQHASYAAQLALKQAILRETFERSGVPPPEKIDVLAGDPWQYRNRIRVAFDRSGQAGYRGRRSHEIISIRECPISAPTLAAAALNAAELLRRSGTSLQLSEISLFCNSDETAMLASVFLREAAESRVLEPFAKEWIERFPSLKGIEFVLADPQQGATRNLHEVGEHSLRYRVDGIDYRVDHGAFFQINRWLLDGFVDRIVSGRAGSLAWDLFAGVGLFTRRLATSFERVIAVESAPAAIRALTANLRNTTGTPVQAETLQFLRSHSRSTKPDLVVVDPPRAGLGAEVTSVLADIAPPEIVYVSCDPATLARDLRGLLQAGYGIVSATLADLFPQTFHLETVVRLQRS